MIDEALCPVCRTPLVVAGCPRCGLARPGTPEPFAVDSRGDESAPQPAATLAQRISGGVLIANAILGIAFFALQTKKGADVPIFGTPLPGIIDTAIGVTLIAGNRKLVPWAIVRVLFGLLVYPAMLAQQSGAAAVFQAVLCLGTLGLLVGRAGPARTVVSIGAIAIVLVIEVLGLAMLATGVSPLAIAGLSATSDPIETSRVHGQRAPWSLSPPGPGWRRMKPAAAAKLNKIVDTWLVFPAADTHIIVIAEQTAAPLGIDRFEEIVTGNLKKGLTGVVVVDSRSIETTLDHARLIRVRGARGEMQLEYEIGLFTRGREIYQVHAWSLQNRFAELEPSFRRTILSFEVE